MSDLPENLDEQKIITKVNSRGEKRKRVKCRPGFKLKGNTCVPMSGSDKANKKKAIRKALKTKRAAGESLKRRTTRKRLKALKKRKSYGL